MLADDASPASLRSYAYELLVWFSFLNAVGVAAGGLTADRGHQSAAARPRPPPGDTRWHHPQLRRRRP